VRSLVNRFADPGAVPRPSRVAAPFHRSLPGYAPTPVHELADRVFVKDESSRLGLPAFKVLGASWAVECVLRERPAVHTLVAASAGNHGRAVARVAAQRGLHCRVFLPARSLEARRAAIASERADVVVVGGTYEDAVALAEEAGREPGIATIADVGGTGTAADVIDGYATLFDEAHAQTSYDLILVPAGVGSLAAAAARHGAAVGVRVVAVEPVTAGCLTASLAVGEPVRIETPGTVMAGLDCAQISPAAWPSLRAGIHGTVLVDDREAVDAMRELAAAGMAIGESGAAPLAALHVQRETGEIGPGTRVLLIATEGITSTVQPHE
jgi:diaminopropionate ammonia-lyase